MRRSGSLALACVLLTAAACGDDTTGSGGASAGGAAAGGASAGGAAAGGGGATSMAAGYGAVTMFSQDMPPSSVVSAAFIAATTGSSTCTSTPEGSCTVTDCDIVNGGTPTTYVSAGDLTVSGGARAVTLTAGADGSYAPDTSTSAALFSAGDSLAVASSGSPEIPGFTGSVTAPASVTISAPNVGPGLVIDRGADLAVTWVGGQAGDVALGLTVAHSDGVEIDHVTSIACAFPASSGHATVPMATLALLPATDAASTGSLSFSVTSTKPVTAGDWAVSLVAIAPATVPGGMAAASQVEVQ